MGTMTDQHRGLSHGMVIEEKGLVKRRTRSSACETASSRRSEVRRGHRCRIRRGQHRSVIAVQSDAIGPGRRREGSPSAHPTGPVTSHTRRRFGFDVAGRSRDSSGPDFDADGRRYVRHRKRDDIQYLAHVLDCLVRASSQVKILRKLHTCWAPCPYAISNLS